MPNISESIDLDNRSRALRRLVIAALEGGERGHLGASLSLIEILRVLYDDIMRYRPEDPAWSGRDRFILSKGHGCLAQYVLLADKGFFPVDELKRFCRQTSFLGGHPEAGKVPGVEASTGALGHGPSIGVGMALAARIKGEEHRVFVVTGDGEIDEGAVWEAAMCAGKHRLSALTIIVDYNKMQSYGSTREVQDLEPLVDKWRAFNFATVEVDGHNVAEMRDTFARLPFDSDRPSAVICHTIKGKGIPFAEQQATWHHKSRLPEEEIDALYDALGGR
jgi:transketolase